MGASVRARILAARRCGSIAPKSHGPWAAERTYICGDGRGWTVRVATAAAPGSSYATTLATAFAAMLQRRTFRRRNPSMNASEAMSLTTPALLFPAISLLLLAYTNRFLTLATIIRQMHPGEGQRVGQLARQQIASLRYRVSLIRHMQTGGVVSFLLCALSMFALFVDAHAAGKILFGLSLLALAVSLVLSLIEVLLSTNALSIVLDDMARPDEFDRGEA